VKRSPRKRSRFEIEAHDHFREAVLAKGDCAWHGSDCPEPWTMDPHHVIRAQTLRTFTSTMRDELRWSIVHDPRVGVPLCRAIHDDVTNASKRLLPSMVPGSVHEFATDHGLVWALESEVPLLRGESVR
jgi:hypothetical protein